MTLPQARPLLGLFLLLCTTPGLASAQTARSPTLAGRGYVELDRATEIAMAQSAAPATVSADATVWLLENGSYHVGIEGSNRNHCLVMRSYPKSVEPLCYDQEGSRTILPIELRRFEMRNGGRSWEEIDAAIEAGIADGTFSAPERPAMSYMLSSAQELYAPDGRNVGNWKPHLMLYLPHMTGEELGMMDGPASDVMMMRAGESLAHLIVVLPEFVDP